ncbi:MAG: hypothetical protein ACK5GZ_06020 [Cyanobium sp.]|jgi:hypothetical protein
MTENNAAVVIRGLALPVVLGWQVGVYCDGCLGGFGPVGVWRDSWGAGRVRALGIDLQVVRLRLVLERVARGCCCTPEAGLSAAYSPDCCCPSALSRPAGDSACCTPPAPQRARQTGKRLWI